MHYLLGLNKTLEMGGVDSENLSHFGEAITMNMQHLSMRGNGQSSEHFTVNSNGDKLANYSILALNQSLQDSEKVYRLAWTFSMVELSKTLQKNCTEDKEETCTEAGLFLNETLTKTQDVQIIWPGNCGDMIYRAIAVRARGSQNQASQIPTLSFQVSATTKVL
jgi:hypothetical protein